MRPQRCRQGVLILAAGLACALLPTRGLPAMRADAVIGRAGGPHSMPRWRLRGGCGEGDGDIDASIAHMVPETAGSANKTYLVSEIAASGDEIEGGFGGDVAGGAGTGGAESPVVMSLDPSHWHDKHTTPMGEMLRRMHTLRISSESNASFTSAVLEGEGPAPSEAVTQVAARVFSLSPIYQVIGASLKPL